MDCLFGFTGLPFDKGSGTYRNATRPYDPATGRWLGEDWIGFDGGDANLNRYCGNSPTNTTDPSGCEAPPVPDPFAGVDAGRPMSAFGGMGMRNPAAAETLNDIQNARAVAGAAAAGMNAGASSLARAGTAPVRLGDWMRPWCVQLLQSGLGGERHSGHMGSDVDRPSSERGGYSRIFGTCSRGMECCGRRTVCCKCESGSRSYAPLHFWLGNRWNLHGWSGPGQRPLHNHVSCRPRRLLEYHDGYPHHIAHGCGGMGCNRTRGRKLSGGSNPSFLSRLGMLHHSMTSIMVHLRGVWYLLFT